MASLQDAQRAWALFTLGLTESTLSTTDLLYEIYSELLDGGGSVVAGASTIAGVTGLQAELDLKSNTSHTHILANLGGLMSITQVAPNTILLVNYDVALSAYPSRPSTRTDIYYAWVGPVAPSIGGVGAVSGVDFWWQTP